MSGFFEDHLNLDTVVAFVDGELSMTAYQRAAAHLVRCGLCSSHVAEQASARESLRSASAPRMPGSLAATLCSIPIAAPISSGIRVEVNPRDVTSRDAAPAEQETRGGWAKRLRLGSNGAASPAAGAGTSNAGAAHSVASNGTASNGAPAPTGSNRAGKAVPEDSSVGHPMSNGGIGPAGRRDPGNRA
ncbi:hypothetical protein D1871_19195 [Nakamurella silvestris]|nr:hypothetical protein D1871_19195 [Nakamurella silvestris]